MDHDEVQQRPIVHGWRRHHVLIGAILIIALVLLCNEHKTLQTISLQTTNSFSSVIDPSKADNIKNSLNVKSFDAVIASTIFSTIRSTKNGSEFGNGTINLDVISSEVFLDQNITPNTVRNTSIIKTDVSDNETTISITTRASSDLSSLTNMTSIDTAEEVSLPRIAYVTGFDLKTTERWINSIFPALEFIVPASDVYYVVLSSNWTAKYYDMIETDAMFRKYSHRIRPLFVDCFAEGYLPESTCCKQEKGLLRFHDEYFRDQESQIRKYDWVLFQDDDNFVRSKELQNFLKPISSLNESVILASGTPGGAYLGKFGYLQRRSPYYCETSPDFRYPWGQPVVYNHVSFEQVSVAFRLGGLTAQCHEYDVYQDVGNAMLHWMLEFPAVWLPQTNGMHLKGSQPFRADILGMHRAGRDGPNSAMKVIYDTFALPEYKFPSESIMMHWTNASGFRSTTTFAKYGSPRTWQTEWHTMPVADCLGKIIINDTSMDDVNPSSTKK